MNPPQHCTLAFSRWFDKSFARLTPPEQKIVDVCVMAFRRQPDQRGHRWHKLTNGLFSISPNDELRVIVHQDGMRYVLLHVGHHDAAYRWANRHRVDRHKVTSEVQLIELPRVVDTSARQTGAAVGVPEATPIFAGEDADYLLSLGVPEDWLSAVMAMTDENALLDLGDRIPDDVIERLIELCSGHRPEPPPPVPADADPWSTSGAARQFRVIADEAALQKALERPWPEWAVWLHPDQLAAAQQGFSGPARVTGPAGTGKTVVALHRAARAARAGARVLLSSFSRALAQRMGEGLDLLLADAPAARELVRVQHLHGLAAEIVAMQRPHPTAMGDRDLDRLVLESRATLSGDRWSDAFLVSEWRSVIDFRGVRSLASYLAVRRQGRGKPLSASAREEIWPVFQRMRETMQRRRLASWSDVCELAAERIVEVGEPPFDRVILDEAQDFSPRDLAFAMQLATPGPDAVFLAGDAGQRIYKYPWSWTDIGLDVRGRARRLRVNYRTSAEICRLSERLLPATGEAMGGDPESRGVFSRFSGPEPALRVCTTREDERAALRAWLAGLLEDGISPGEIAVLGRTHDRLADALDAPARALGLSRQALHETASDRLFAGTLHGSKGLEFRAVAIVGAEAETIPLERVLAAETDAVSRAALDEQERHLLYVGITRARDRVLVTCAGNPSPFLRELGVTA